MPLAPVGTSHSPKGKSMMSSRWFRVLSLSSVLFVSSCIENPGDAEDSDPGADGTVVHVMPMTTPEKVVDAAPAGARLTFFGGPTLTHVSVHPVFWNANTQFQTNI